MYPYDVRRWLDGDPGEPPPPDGAPARPQQRLAAPRLVRRARDARPVGVPVVRGVGPRLPLRAVGAPRSGVREVPARRAAARVVPAPQRRAAGLRVELRRRQPAGARDGRAARVRRSTAAATASSSSGSSRSCWSTSRGGSTGRTPTATTSSAAASSGSTTSARSTARTCREGMRARAGRRHGVDGVLRAVDARCIALVLAEENDVYLDMVIKFLEQFLLIARALESQGLYDAEDAFFYDRLVVPVGRGDAGQGADDRRAAPGAARPSACRTRDRGRAPALRQAVRAAARRAFAETAAAVGRVRELGDERAGALSVIDPEQLRRTLGSSSTRRRSSRPTGCARVSKRYENNPYTLDGRARRRGSTTSRPSRRRPCSAATRTGAARSGCRSTTWPSASSCIFQRFFGDDFKVEYPTGSGQERTFGEIAQDLADRIVVDLAARTPTAAGRSTAASSGCRRTRPGRTTCSSTSTSTATTVPASARRTRPAGRRSSST